MRRLFGWMAGLAGIAALARVLSTRHARLVARRPAPVGEHGADPADVLRRKLSESRAEPSVPEPAPVVPAEPSETLEERRARVHAKAQEALRAMEEPPA